MIFSTTFGHVPGREELALLDVDGLAGFGGGNQQIGLPAKEGRDLQHIDRWRDARALRCVVHVGEHRNFQRVADLGEDGQRRVEADAARTLGRGAVGLVEGGLVDEADADARRDFLQRRRHFQRMRPAFHLAGPGDQRQRQGIAEAHGADGDGGIGFLIQDDFALAGATMKRQCDAVNGGLHQPALLHRRADEGSEQRVRLERSRFQFGMELHADEPGMVLVFDDLRQNTVRRHA